MPRQRGRMLWLVTAPDRLTPTLSLSLPSSAKQHTIKMGRSQAREVLSFHLEWDADGGRAAANDGCVNVSEKKITDSFCGVSLSFWVYSLLVGHLEKRNIST